MSSVKHTTKSGITIEFGVYTPDTTWNAVAGVYVFGSASASGGYNVLYVGQTNSFKDRFYNHEHWHAAKRAGMTHVLAVRIPLQGNRDKIEAILIQEWKPPLNTIGK